jgi:hypothetical protein
MTKLTDALDRNHERPGSKGGLICPICGGRSFEVVRTQNNVTKQIRRVRMCKSCGRKIQTIEVIVNEGKSNM